MLSEPRTISLICELVHVPVTHSPARLREVYSEVCARCDYENFLRIQGGARIERRSPDREGFSQLNLLTDRIQLTEDHTGTSTDAFARKVIAVLEIALPRLQIPLLLMQQNTVRMVTTPNSFRSASEFLALSLFKVDAEKLKPLGRPTSVFGMRLLFPPTKEQPENYNVRVESYVRDAKALYVENMGTFKKPIQPTQLAVVETHLARTAEFLGTNVMEFLSAYDQRS